MAETSILVTGGAGLIGSNLARALNQRGHTQLIVVDHLNGKPGKQRNLDRITFAEYLDKAEFIKLVNQGQAPEVDAVFHLGACSSTIESNESYLENNNTEYTKTLCNWAVSQGARFIYASSAATYGNGSEGYCDDETLLNRYRPLNLYGMSKHKFDLWAQKQDLLKQIVGIKYFNVYGPGEDHKGEMRSLVQKAYHQIRAEGRLKLFKSHRSEYEDGKQQRDFIHVEDAVAITLFFYDHPDVNGIFNCGTGIARTWIDLANSLFEAMSLEPNIDFVDMPEAIRPNYQYHTEADLAKLRRAGYTTPPLTLEEGVRRYVEEWLMDPLQSGP